MISVPRADRSRARVALDTGLPAVVMWSSNFPLQHSCLGVLRTLGRAGVPVYAALTHRSAPVATSRYATGRILWLGGTHEDLLERLIEFGRHLGRRSLLVATGDEKAVLVAEHRDVLEEHFVLPAVPPELPGQLADKNSLAGLCHRHGFATPRSALVNSMAELEAVLEDLPAPVVVKSTALRGTVQSVENTTVVASQRELLDLAWTWQEPFSTLIQEYLPDEVCEDWFSHGYCDGTATARVVFTGRKVRCWPVRGGATAAAFTAVNPELERMAATFCAAVGYQGIFDIDWRRDLRTGQYYLLDFNPRLGAQFRMFENDAGIDVVRAMHLDLSGRPIPAGNPIDGERFIVEPWDLMSLAADRNQPWTGGVGRPRLAWWANDDPKPVFATAWHQAELSVRERLGRAYEEVPPTAWGHSSEGGQIPPSSRRSRAVSKFIARR